MNITQAALVEKTDSTYAKFSAQTSLIENKGDHWPMKLSHSLTLMYQITNWKFNTVLLLHEPSMVGSLDSYV